jgi:hypothetical protein
VQYLGSALEPRRQVGDVPRVEANGGADVDGAQLAALDKTLDGPRMNAQKRRRLPCREKRGWRRLRLRTTGGDTRARLALPITSARVSVSRVVRLRRWLGDGHVELELPRSCTRHK